MYVLLLTFLYKSTNSASVFSWFIYYKLPHIFGDEVKLEFVFPFVLLLALSSQVSASLGGKTGYE